MQLIIAYFITFRGFFVQVLTILEVQYFFKYFLSTYFLFASFWTNIGIIALSTMLQ